MIAGASDRDSARALWTALVVDDTAEARRLILQKLRPLPLRLFQATDVFDALARFPEVRPDIVITDLNMPGADGLALLRRIREFADVPIVLLTAYGSVATCERAILGGAQRFLQWTDGIDDLPRVTLELLEGRPRTAAPPALDVASARRRKSEELRTQLERLLRECNGNVAMIAQRMQKDRATVTYHLKRFGLFRTEPSAAAPGCTPRDGGEPAE